MKLSSVTKNRDSFRVIILKKKNKNNIINPHNNKNLQHLSNIKKYNIQIDRQYINTNIYQFKKTFLMNFVQIIRVL